MSSPESPASPGGNGAGANRGVVHAVTALPWWKKMLLSFVGFLFVAGVGLRAVEEVAGESTATRHGTSSSTDGEQSTTSPNIGHGLVDGEPTVIVDDPPYPWERDPDPTDPGDGEPGDPREGQRYEDGETMWSPALVKGSLSFFIGFCLGYALRAFFKMSLILLGLVLGCIFGLSYMGFVTVEWHAMESYFSSFAESARDEIAEFHSFVTGKLPSAALAGLGLFTGFKKNGR